MRLTRRLLAVVAFLALIVVLVRYRRSVEHTIEEAIQEVSAEWKAADEEAKAKNRELPQVILPIEKSDEEKKASIAQAVEEKAHGVDKPSSDPAPDTNQADAKHSVGSPSVGGSKGDHDTIHQAIGDTKDIEAFWAKWSRAIYESRPKVPKIALGGRAHTQKPKEGQVSREPYRDHLRNAEEDIDILRLLHRKFVSGLEKEFGNHTIDGEQQERQWEGSGIFKGKGVVMVGGGEYFGPAIISIHMLRRTGSNLPVEVFVPDESEYEEALCKNYLKKLGAHCVVLSRILDKSKIKVSQKDDAELKITHYQLKSLALLLSSYSEVLLLDSDSIPVLDPLLNIFETEPYKSKGMVIWPDYWRSTESPRYWQIAGKPDFPSFLPATASEAGQLAVNKATHLAPLLLATYYNIFGPDYYYPLLSQGALGQGDKETFLAAAVALNATYYRIKTPAASLGRHDGRTQKGTAMVQHLPSDDLKHESTGHESIRPMFLHSNTPKMNAGHLVDEGDLLAADGETRLRLLGSKDELVKRFGFDVEQSIWDLMVQTGCELQDIIQEWKGRERMCERLTEHYKKVFGP
ncbi:lpha-mannosyltransferase [Diaporthe amygdali]|uniref:lpha-mannosyltransferase n=1 Tax=Phomopsis amygdali TaxID=1214568 RepID=UPI0022FE2928|nr:lpha-mannosyltransferase [Diaporthe amygdali]KAJ0118734.1 lpha-mannosyltransferase [Diaporthe amygdali]